MSANQKLIGFQKYPQNIYRGEPWNKGKGLHYTVWNKGLKGRQEWMNIDGLKLSWSGGENHHSWKGGKPLCKRSNCYR